MSTIKQEDIFEFLGVKPETIEDFKKAFETEFIRKSLVTTDKELTGKIYGSRLGSLETKAKSITKKYGLELLPEEIKDKQVEDLLEMSFAKMAEANKKAVEELEKQLSGTKEDVAKSWQEKYTKVEQKSKDLESLLEKTSSDFEGFKLQTTKERKSDKLNIFKEQALSKLKYKPGIKDVEKIGFITMLDQKYDFDIDEKDNSFFPKDKGGNRIPSAKTTGKFKSVEEIFEEEGISADVVQINNVGTTTKPIVNNQVISDNKTIALPQMFGQRFQNARQ